MNYDWILRMFLKYCHSEVLVTRDSVFVITLLQKSSIPLSMGKNGREV